VTFGIVLVIVGGFLLGGAYSVWSGFGDPARGRSGTQLAVAAVLLLAAVLATVAGVLRF
jgi:uncharacterized protein involved in response to NO